ncbi:mRNA interferase YafQ [Trichococcus flocculiformis]|uniref:type II toxin-antitoxin system YafQ family toxin n=1 Tax=Trichococcus TaxID=82802 RepID=UPI0007A7E1AB|nr:MULTISPECIES: type II toxin-antitoxin system YafQ family toxin [Trichococcus]CZQ97255.1 plasmid stabilisation system protein [Trichococcus sp. ES5]SHF55942.1 mRNA interferase YafQ [Trichococcus flocculiformis]
MLEMQQSTKFKKDIKRLQKRNYKLERLKSVMKMIVEEVPLPEDEYRAHLLEPTKDFHNCWECHISGRKSDWLLIYKYYLDENLVVFIRTGTHADVF